MENAAKSRLASLDNLRILLATLVVAHHAGQAYGPTGGSWPIHNPELALWLGPFFGVNAAFFMGLFFWIAGYFTPAAFDRKGARAFLSDRLLRIGAPLVTYWLLVSVPISYIYESGSSTGLSFASYYVQPWHWDWGTVYMHLWFLGHLLVYALVYAAWRVWRGGRPLDPRAPPAGHGTLLAIVLVMAAVSTLARFEFPQDRWVLVGIPVEPAHLPQYVLMFALGILAARTGWLERVPSHVGWAWLTAGLATAAGIYLYVFGRAAGGPDIVRLGGWDWRTGVFALWEALVCVGLGVGLIVLFRDRLAGSNRLSRELAADTYGVYIVHIVVLVGLQTAVAGADAGPTAKFLYVTAAGLVASFAAAAGLRRLPGARHVL